MRETNFKHTEIGLIPQDWEVKTVSDLFTIKAAGDLIKDAFSSSKDSFHRYPIFSNSAENKGLYGYSSVARFAGGSFTITGRGNLGIAEYRSEDFDAIIRLLVLTPLAKDSSKFYSYYTNFFHPFEGSATSIPQLSIPNVANGLVIAPPTLEQQRIGEALSDVDELIEGLRKLIEKKKAIKQGAMADLLSGRRRLPGFTSSWKSSVLGELGFFFKGKGISRAEAQSGQIPAIRYGEIYTDHHDYIKCFRSWISEEVATSAFQLESGDLCFAASGETLEEIGKTVAFIGTEKAYAGGDIIVLRPSKELSSLYFGFLLNTFDVIRQKSLKGHGLSIMHIKAASLAEISVTYPSDIKEQEAIAKILADMDEEIDALEAKLKKYEAVKQGMMQQLLTGKIRLINPKESQL